MNVLRNALLAALGVAAFAAATPAAAASILNVDWDTNCGKSNCFTQGRYTHTWSSGAASTPVTIGQLVLDRGILGDLAGQTFRLSFQLNGEEVGSWGNYTMGRVGGEELNFWGENFTWNPEDGDLVLVLEIFELDSSGAGGSSARSSSTGGDETEQDVVETPLDIGQGQNGAQGPGPAAIPEPGTWALMIGGFGLAGAALRRRRAAVGLQPAG